MVGDTCFTAEGTTWEVTNVWLKNMGSDRSFVDQIKMNRSTGSVCLEYFSPVITPAEVAVGVWRGWKDCRSGR
ncbi:hypothetical protein HanIR_Chr16g0806421 [Helianthus annuus]|nr:hypothetical protein HanIR_Chr16g0806421 [Helianthus annuus]